MAPEVPEAEEVHQESVAEQPNLVFEFNEDAQGLLGSDQEFGVLEGGEGLPGRDHADDLVGHIGAGDEEDLPREAERLEPVD